METKTRQPLAVGNVYQFHGYPTKIKIVGMSLPGTPSDDGGLPGVAVKWLGNCNLQRGWYPFRSEAEFWDALIFRNAYDPV